ncbi:MAG TPA: hypothetical protein VGM82_00035 [Gemmatimonadaceae bacterium]
MRAYRTLFPSHAADATLARLADRDNPPGYLARVLVRAYERAARLGAYTADDLVANTIGEIVATIAGPKGAIAEGAWALYLETCMEEAFRGLVGRTGARAGSHAASNGAADDDVVPGASTEAIAATAWRARVEPDHLEWLESFIERTMAKIPDADMRAIALDLFSETPTPVHSTDPNEQNTLTRRFGVNRKTIYRWQANVRSLLYHALNRQNERMIDLSFLAYRS